MTTPFEIQHMLTREQLKENLTMLYDRLLKPQRIFVCLCGAATIGISPFAFADDLRFMLIFIGLGIFFLISALFFYSKRQAFVTILATKKLYENAPVHYEFCSDEIHMHFADSKRKPSVIPYGFIVDAVETDDVLHLLIKSQLAVVLPKNAFTLDELSDLRVFITEKTSKEITTLH